MVGVFCRRGAFLWYLATAVAPMGGLGRVAADGPEPGCDRLALELVSPDVKAREAALAELNRVRRRSKGEFDLEHKLLLFKQIVALDSPNYAYRATCFLAKLPVDDEVLTLAKRAVADEKCGLSLLIGSLAYAEGHAPEEFGSFFRSRKYEEHDKAVLALFAASEAVQEIRHAHFGSLVDSYLTWQPGDVADTENPFRPAILRAGNSIVPELHAALSTCGQNRGSAIKVVWILGEIGSPESFDLLLTEYLAAPSHRVGISLGACLGSLNVERLFAEIDDTRVLKQLLSDVYGRDWGRVESFALPAIRNDMIKNLQVIRENCKRRSVPMLG